MRILALEPYYDGSHRQFIDDWIRRSCHDWTLLTLPGYFWKWRMRHAGLTFARQVHEKYVDRDFDAVFCSDMLNLPEFLGLAGAKYALPCVLYFHENQLTYPDARRQGRDLHFAMTNFLSAVAARGVWFNSHWHGQEFLRAMEQWMQQAPDYRPADALEQVRSRLHVHPPGIEIPTPRKKREPGPLRIGWVSRWERDKNPKTFFEVIDRLAQAGEDFRLLILGQSFQQVPGVFDQGRQRHLDRIEQWGFLESREDYRNALGRMDVVVSTAEHEFFGIAIAEAVAAGALPLLPDRLAYPELLSGLDETQRRCCLFGSARELSSRLIAMAQDIHSGRPLPLDPSTLRKAMMRFEIGHRAGRMDLALESLAG
jgi:glycosyltransferase involved in cell wall biosynthesis